MLATISATSLGSARALLWSCSRVRPVRWRRLAACHCCCHHMSWFMLTSSSASRRCLLLAFVNFLSYIQWLHPPLPWHQTPIEALICCTACYQACDSQHGAAFCGCHARGVAPGRPHLHHLPREDGPQHAQQEAALQPCVPHALPQVRRRSAHTPPGCQHLKDLPSHHPLYMCWSWVPENTTASRPPAGQVRQELRTTNVSCMCCPAVRGRACRHRQHQFGTTRTQCAACGEGLQASRHAATLHCSDLCGSAALAELQVTLQPRTARDPPADQQGSAVLQVLAGEAAEMSSLQSLGV